MIPIDTKGYSMLEIFAKSDSHREGTVELKDSKGEVRREKAGVGAYRLIRIPVEKEANYQLDGRFCQFGICYLSGHDNIMEEGVCFLENGRQYGKGDLGEIYDTPYREQYHFNPIHNWINDPNGLCWYQGNYHMFYQANPHGQVWDNMYWGHGVSRDLIHWIHLPYALEPQESLLGDPGRKGGAFSGSAVALEDRVVFYLTRHDGPMDDGAETVEWQTMTESKDLLTFQPEREIIRQKPAGAGHDFRDPKVVKLKDGWYLVLGSNLDGVSAILLYRSEDGEHWEYAGPLLTEPDRKATTIECPDFFYLDGSYVAVGALMKHTDDWGRYQMTRCYIGDFKDGRLEVSRRQWFDFGSNFYAVQSFEHQGRRIAMGWISDFYGEHVEVPGGAYGSMSLPRELQIRDGRLFVKPAEEVYELLGNQIYSGCAMVGLPKIRGNAYYVKARFTGYTDFQFLLGEDGDASIWLEQEHGTVGIRTMGTASSAVRFPAEVEWVKTVEIFVDRRTVEVFINGGEAAGTKVFYCSRKDGIFNARIQDIQKLGQIELYEMKSIWV